MGDCQNNQLMETLHTIFVNRDKSFEKATENLLEVARLQHRESETQKRIIRGLCVFIVTFNLAWWGYFLFHNMERG